MLVFGDLLWIPFTFSIQACNCVDTTYISFIILSTVSRWHVNSSQKQYECLITLWLDCLLLGTGLVAFAQQSRTNSSCYCSQLLCVLDRVSSVSLFYITFLETKLRNSHILFLAGTWFLEGLTNKNISLRRTLKHLYGVSLQWWLVESCLLQAIGIVFVSFFSFFSWLSEWWTMLR